MAVDRAKGARDALEASRRAAVEMVQGAGARRTNELLERSAALLRDKLASVAPSLGEDSFTVAQLRATLAQVQHVLVSVTIPALHGTVVDVSRDAAADSARMTATFMAAADKAYRGVGDQPIALKSAAMMEAGVQGAHASVLRRLASSGDPNVKGASRRKHRAKPGILARYGIETVKDFEQTLQAGMIAKRSWVDMREDITRRSPFLQGKPSYWAHRIVRTEVMAAHNSSAHHSIVKAKEQLPDMLKILSETFDDRTAADSYADHGQVRRPEEEFENWYGTFPYPPGRPNDRAVVVPHRARWPLPDELQPMSDDEIDEAWAREKRKGDPPERPLMSTVPGFGES